MMTGYRSVSETGKRACRRRGEETDCKEDESYERWAGLGTGLRMSVKFWIKWTFGDVFGRGREVTTQFTE